MAEGVHDPVSPLDEVAGKAGTGLPAQITSDVPKLNVGIVLALTVTVKVVDVAH